MEILRSAVSQVSPDKVPTGGAAVRKVTEVPPLKKTAEPPVRPVSEEQVQDAVAQANKLAVAFDRSLKYEYKKEADVYQVSVIDTSKDEVVRKIPPDEVVRFLESIKDLFGALLDVQA